jgi:hypothetical protein
LTCRVQNINGMRPYWTMASQIFGPANIHQHKF